MTSPRTPVAGAVLSRAGVPHRLHEHPPARTESELHLTGLDVDTSAKTLAFSLPDGRLVLAAIPGRARLRYGSLARALGVPRSALRGTSPEELLALGMEPGGVTPVCDDPRATLVMDAGLLAHDVLYCGSGLADVSVELSASDLAALSPATTLIADLCGDPERRRRHESAPMQATAFISSQSDAWRARVHGPGTLPVVHD